MASKMGAYKSCSRRNQPIDQARDSTATNSGNGLEEDEVEGVASGPEERDCHIERDCMTEQLGVEVRKRGSRARDAMRQNEGGEEDSRDADDVNEDILEIGVVRGLQRKVKSDGQRSCATSTVHSGAAVL